MVKENQEENQQESRQRQSKSQNIYYYLHQDDFYSTHKKPLLIFGDKLYQAFIKETVRKDMYYIVHGKIYVKLWNDSRGNILVYISSMVDPNLFFNTEKSILKVDYIKYDNDTKTVSCNSGTITKIVALHGFDLLGTLEELAPELITPALAVICFKLT